MIRKMFFSIGSLALMLAATSHASTLTFQGSSHPPIPLNTSQPVQVQADGNVLATCLFQTQNPTLCQGIGTGNPIGAPVVALSTSLSLVSGSPDTYQGVAGQSFTVTRTLTGGAADVCLTSATNLSQTNGWSSVGNTSGESTVTINVEGAFTLGLRCYNAGGASAQPVELKFQMSAPVGPNPLACSLRDQGITDPLLQPANFTRYVRTWPQVFNGFVFPSTPSTAMPVGSYSVTLNQGTSPPSAGMYLAIPVTLGARSRLNILTTLPTGGFPSTYVLPRAGSVFVSLSPCAGDLRPQSASAPDVYARHCRGQLTESTINFFTLSGSGCSVPPGDYWLNIMHANPAVPGFSNTSETCFPLEENNPDARCELNFSMQYTVFP